MKRILILFLLFPFTPLKAGSARRVGTAIVKLMEYLKYTDGQTRSQCIATHKMLLHEHSTEKMSLSIEAGVIAMIAIKPLNTEYVTLWIKDRVVEQDVIKNTTIIPTKSLALQGGSFSCPLPGLLYEDIKIEIQLSKNGASN